MELTSGSAVSTHTHRVVVNVASQRERAGTNTIIGNCEPSIEIQTIQNEELVTKWRKCLTILE